jgi:hypothetical protein
LASIEFLVERIASDGNANVVVCSVLSIIRR